MTDEELKTIEKRWADPGPDADPYDKDFVIADRTSVMALIAEIRRLRAQKDQAYAERNRVVALLARMAIAFGLRAGLGEHPVEDLAWEPDWRTIVYIDLPTGQVSWHFHDSEKPSGLLPYPDQWDGHSDEVKWSRVNSAYRARGKGQGT